jgi:hypothetical protein
MQQFELSLPGDICSWMRGLSSMDIIYQMGMAISPD